MRNSFKIDAAAVGNAFAVARAADAGNPTPWHRVAELPFGVLLAIERLGAQRTEQLVEGAGSTPRGMALWMAGRTDELGRGTEHGALHRELAPWAERPHHDAAPIAGLDSADEADAWRAAVRRLHAEEARAGHALAADGREPAPSAFRPH